ncbi:MAG: NUDIX hydrolase [Candidatus Omnitrophica bacterium]|nr:NUDIX hydrolase [Candidatus Omnitrophota bacterium]
MSLEVIKSDLIYRGRLVNFQVDTLRTADGKEIKREVLVHPGAAVIIPKLDEDRVLLVRQYRHAAERVLWEFPAGTLEPDEPTEVCARRELREETGYEAKSIKAVLAFYPSPGISQEKMFLFVADGLKLVDETPLEAGEIRVELKKIKDLNQMVSRGEIIDAKTIIGILYLTLSREGREGLEGREEA